MVKIPASSPQPAIAEQLDEAAAWVTKFLNDGDRSGLPSAEARIQRIAELLRTSRHARGFADASDEGELRLAVATDHQQGIVRLVFGTPTTWIGLPSQEARDLAAILIEKANELDSRRT